MSVPEDLLRRSSLRVDLRGTPSGTGFFVAPGLAVTCAHVLLPEGPTANVDVTRVGIWGPDGATVSVVAVKEIWPEENVDLAILQVRAGSDSVCALLDTDVAAGDELQSYGYPGKYPEGTPTTFEAEGSMGGTGWVKVKEGQVLPGLSGSPVLNVRTGAVCGVLKRSRDPAQDLGGYVIPMSTLADLSSNTMTENECFHSADSAWLDELTLEQREAWWTPRGGARPGYKAARHLVLTVGQDHDRWQVAAVVHRGDDDLPPVGVDLNTVREQVARLFRGWGARGRLPEGDQVRLLGSILSCALFPGRIGATLREFLDGSDERVLVSLRFEDESDPDLVHLPWEHLYLPEEGTRGDVMLATETKIGFARVLAPEPALELPEPEQPILSVLVVAARPQGSADAKDAVQIGEAVKHLENLADDTLRIETVIAPRPNVLATRVTEGDYDVIHYLGFGAFSEGVDSLALGGGAMNGLDFYPVAMLKQALSKRPPQLVVLQLCENSQAVVPADFAMLAPPLVRLPIPAAVAYQYPVAPAAATTFNEALYTALADGKPIDMAVQEGRSQLTFQVDHPRAFVSPALFLRQPAELRLVRTGGARTAGRAREHPLVMSVR